MRPIVSLLLLSVAAATLPALPAAAQTASLKLGSDKVPAATGTGDWIEVQSWRWGTSIPTTAGEQPAREVRKPADIGSLTITARMDPASCKLGAQYDGARLRTKYLDYVLEDAMVSCCATGGSSAGELPLESVSLNYAKVTKDYKPQDDKKPAKPPPKWDLKKGSRE